MLSFSSFWPLDYENRRYYWNYREKLTKETIIGFSRRYGLHKQFNRQFVDSFMFIRGFFMVKVETNLI